MISVPPFSIATGRLLIDPLGPNDKDFIFRLVNTEGWIRFIGNRNIHSPAEAAAYIQRILQNENMCYWIVKLKDSGEPIGLVTFIKRDYLEYRDIGFAFLPEHTRRGYAYEATIAVLNNLPADGKNERILATTIPENENSIKLLEKIGLRFEREIEVGGERLFVFGADTDKIIVH